MKLQFKLDKQDFSQWKFINCDNNEIIESSIFNHFKPQDYQLLDGDIISAVSPLSAKEDDFISSIERITNKNERNLDKICGVLQLNKNRSFGKEGKKHLYRFIPSQSNIPQMLIPYTMKNKGFNKSLKNKYAIVKFKEWSSKQRHPHGELIEVIGDTCNDIAFYKFQFHKNNLEASTREINRNIVQKLKTYNQDNERNAVLLTNDIYERYNEDIVDLRNEENIISIDPEGCIDIDDAFSCEYTDYGFIVKIHIANVALLVDFMNLWKLIENVRCSTVYLPDKKYPMIPTILSDNICSLLEKQDKLAFTCEIDVNTETQTITPKFYHSFINVERNYSYDEIDILEKRPTSYGNICLAIDSIKEIIGNQNQTHNYGVLYNMECKDSHTIIEYLMIMMNTFYGRYLYTQKTGIFRVMTENIEVQIHNTDEPDEVTEMRKIFLSQGGEYVPYNELDGKIHAYINVDYYAHITSPIRRIVDLYNMYQFLKLECSKTDNSSHLDINHEVVNQQMKDIRKAQRECYIWHNTITNPELLQKTYIGYILSVDTDNNDSNIKHYTFYIPDVKRIVSKKTSKHISIHNPVTLKFYVFENESNLTRKIQVDIVE